MANVVLVEIKPGIDMDSSDLVTDINQYWLQDETEAAVMTHYDGAIATDIWKVSVDGTAYELNDTGTTSPIWELDGTAVILS